ncbi:MAG: hypothetical protein ACKOCM_09370 [Cyanobacteriota bacterium]
MPWFVKTETFNAAFLALDRAERSAHLSAHRAWVASLRLQALPIASGFLVDGDRRPGGGGLLLLQASSHAEALALIQQDPMISGGWVTWQLHEWIAAVGDLAVADLAVADPGGLEDGGDQRG